MLSPRLNPKLSCHFHRRTLDHHEQEEKSRRELGVCAITDPSDLMHVAIDPAKTPYHHRANTTATALKSSTLKPPSQVSKSGREETKKRALSQRNLAEAGCRRSVT
ncbi:hypothetical protein YC2023_025183 [Brassica napus]|uniref:(rape) hypothetical protein n=1 Tax=Brassica napus TaxID=3708 RepID=A0A816X758_BRANA|nr:unnamed protein product [Brassica napus]